MDMSFESNVAFHCAPTLAAIKPSNLFTWRHAQRGCVKECIAQLTHKLSGRGIIVETLREYRDYTLILVYREDMLEHAVNQPDIRDFLSYFGYTESMDLRGCLRQLKARVRDCGDFPHEIGIFLGYPLYDVAAFINSPHKRCSLCGEWKVYENEDYASRLFERFRKCRAELYARFVNGNDIAELVA